MDVKFDEVFEHVMMNAVIAGCAGDGVLDGLVVSENGAGASMHVDVSAGSCIVDDITYTESSITENLAITQPHFTLARKDIVVYDTSAGTPVVVTGTAAAIPQPPDIPAGDIILALVNVAADAFAIYNADIIDGRVFIESFPADAGGSGNLIDTIYQNGSRPRFVVLGFHSTAGNNIYSNAYVFAYTEVASPPTGVFTRAGIYGGVANQSAFFSIMMIVPPYYFYKMGAVVSDTGVVTKYNWSEYDF